MRTLTIALLFAALSAPLPAQERHQRRGFWMGLGLGGGSMGITCETCGTDRVHGPAGYIRLGGTLSKHFLLGAELQGWSISAFGVNQAVGATTLSVLWYPSATGAFYFQGGLGAGQYVRESFTSQTIEEAGVLSLGAGYEWRIFRNTSLVPYFSATTMGTPWAARDDGVLVVTDEFSRNIVHIGVGVTFH